MFASLRRSLITRLMAYFMLVGLLLVIAFGVNFAKGLRTHFIEGILPNVAQYLDYIIDDIGAPPDLEKAQRLSDKLAFELAISGPGIDWRSHQRIPDVASLEFRSAKPPYQQYRHAHRRGNTYLLLQRGDYRYLYVVGRLFQGDRDERGLGLLLIVIAAMGLLAWLIRASLKPLRSIDEAIGRIGQGDLKTGLEPSGSLEFKRLGEGINAMAEQIDAMLDAKQQLLLAVSHELRSPLTRLRVNLELIDDDSARAALVEDLHEMEALIAMILESERLNQRHVSLNLSSFALDELVREVQQQFFSAQSLVTQLNPLELQADRTRLELLIKNLLDNACKYSDDDGRAPEIRLSRQQNLAVLEVQDWGRGMTAEQLARAKEAFYRADAARQRSTGGFGLGLYLCDRIVQAHRGRLELQSTPGEGVLVRVELPLEQASV